MFKVFFVVLGMILSFSLLVFIVSNYNLSSLSIFAIGLGLGWISGKFGVVVGDYFDRFI